MAAGERGGGPRPHRADRVVLVRHRRRPACRSTLPDLADLGLGEELQIECDLREHPRRDLQRGAELGDAHAVRVPGHGRLGEAELPGEERRDLDAAVAERREGPGGSAELRREAPIRELAQPLTGVEHRHEPARGLEPERRRHGLLQQRPRRHRRVPVRSREGRAGVRHAAEVGEHQPERSPGDQHRRGVHHVLARSAEVHPPRVLLSHACDERAHERLGRGAGSARLREQLLPVVLVGGARGGDRRRRVDGDDSRGGARVGERPLRVEHRREPRAPRHRLLQRGRDEQGLERRHPAKNVVCCGPCKRMSKRRPPSSATATRVSRRSGERRDSTGSASFASTSSGK